MSYGLVQVARPVRCAAGPSKIRQGRSAKPNAYSVKFGQATRKLTQEQLEQMPESLVSTHLLGPDSPAELTLPVPADVPAFNLPAPGNEPESIFAVCMDCYLDESERIFAQSLRKVLAGSTLKSALSYFNIPEAFWPPGARIAMASQEYGRRGRLAAPKAAFAFLGVGDDNGVDNDTGEDATEGLEKNTPLLSFPVLLDEFGRFLEGEDEFNDCAHLSEQEQDELRMAGHALQFSASRAASQTGGWLSYTRLRLSWRSEPPAVARRSLSCANRPQTRQKMAEAFVTIGNLSLLEKDAGTSADQHIHTQLQKSNSIEGIQKAQHILEADPGSEPNHDEDGTFYSPGPVEFFQIVSEQVELVAGVTDGEPLLQLGQAVQTALLHFQERQMMLLPGSKLSQMRLCALVNDNLYVHDQFKRFAEGLDTRLADNLKGKLSTDAACRGCTNMAQFGILCLVDYLFAQQQTSALFFNLYCSPEWSKGEITASILAAFTDYFRDYVITLKRKMFMRLTEAVLEETVQWYVAALLTFCPQKLDDDTLTVMGRDRNELRTFFKRLCKDDKVLQALQPLDKLLSLAEGSQGQKLVDTYKALLQVAPGVTPDMVQKILEGHEAPSDSQRVANTVEALSEMRTLHAEHHEQLRAARDLAAATETLPSASLQQASVLPIREQKAMGSIIHFAF
ncbi:hypothetical protein WJX73_007269 [Symbiochloris irregularis]|uniref:Exocyst complex component Sec6 n=1 Tax=Symbiochloris irregularis TaxID=706552 RepID=A0AAW1P4T1_9CHLO